MKKVLQVIAIAAVLMMSEIAFSQTVVWKDIRWDAYDAARIAENDDGYLEVKPTRYYGGAAHYSTPIDFRSARTPWIEATFLNDGQSSGIQLVMKNKHRAYTKIGAWGSDKNYVIYWYNYQSGSEGLVVTSIVRSPGQHTLRLGMQENGTVDYWIDDVRVWTTNNINPDNFEDIYLTAQVSTGTFVDYQFGTDYSPPLLTVEIKIDIKPGSDPNSVNPRSKGKIPVAILSTMDFDAPAKVDLESLTFGGTGEDKESLAFCNPSPEDVNGDGFDDLVCHFYTQETGFICRDTEGILRGQTMEGDPIEGSDSVRIVPSACKDQKETKKDKKK